MKVFVFGNGTISFESFQFFYQKALGRLAEDGARFLVGDYRGTDILTMEFLKDKTSTVFVYHMFETPRYMPSIYKSQVSKWTLIGGFKGDAERDAAMIECCTHFLGIDQNTTQDRKSGSYKNIKTCKQLKKVLINRDGDELIEKEGDVSEIRY